MRTCGIHDPAYFKRHLPATPSIHSFQHMLQIPRRNCCNKTQQTGTAATEVSKSELLQHKSANQNCCNTSQQTGPLQHKLTNRNCCNTSQQTGTAAAKLNKCYIFRDGTVYNRTHLWSMDSAMNPKRWATWKGIRPSEFSCVRGSTARRERVMEAASAPEPACIRL